MRSGGLLVQEAWSGGCLRLKGHLKWRPHRAALLPDEGAGEGRVQEAGLQGAGRCQGAGGTEERKQAS